MSRRQFADVADLLSSNVSDANQSLRATVQTFNLGHMM
jgi:hypothetical protein